MVSHDGVLNFMTYMIGCDNWCAQEMSHLIFISFNTLVARVLLREHYTTRREQYLLVIDTVTLVSVCTCWSWTLLH